MVLSLVSYIDQIKHDLNYILSQDLYYFNHKTITSPDDHHHHHSYNLPDIECLDFHHFSNHHQHLISRSDNERVFIESSPNSVYYFN